MNSTTAMLALGGLALVNYWIKRSIFYPPFIFCVMWTFDLLIYNLQLIEIVGVHDSTILMITAGAFVFTFGGLVAALIPIKSHNEKGIIAKIEIPETVKIVILLGLIVGLGFQVREFMTFAERGFGADLFLNARTTMVNDVNEGLTAGSISNIIDITTLSIYFVIILAIAKFDRYFWIAFVVSGASCILSTGRIYFLLLISSIFCVYMFQRGMDKFKSAIRTLIMSTSLFLCVFVGLIFLNKDTSGVQTALLMYARDHTVEYVVGPLAGLDFVLSNENTGVRPPNHTFKVFLRNADRIGLISYTPPPSLDDFVFIPFNVNVFTIYKFYYFDFGIFGMYLSILCISFLHVVIFRMAKAKKGYWLYLFSLTIYPAIMVIFDDQYSSFLLYINAILCIGVLKCLIGARVMIINSNNKHGSALGYD